jgi:tetratricopeptide (TPR) repeat protein
MTPVLQNALRLHRSGAVGEAEKIYLEVLAKDAADPIALHYLGLVRLRQSRLEEALELMRRSVAIAPSQADFHLNLGIALLDAGRPAEAIHSLQVTTLLKPALARAHLQLGKALCLAGQHERALKSLRTAADMDPQHRGSALHLLAAVEEARGNRAEAERYAALSALESPGAVDYRVHLAALLERRKAFEAALAQYDEALAVSDPAATLLLKRTLCLLKLSRTSEALSTIDQAVAIDSPSARIISTRAEVLLALGRFRDAAREYGLAFDADTALADNAANAAITCLLAGEYAEGWRRFEQRYDWPQRIAVESGVRLGPVVQLPPLVPRWQGPPARVGTLLVMGEQGLGDEIMFGTLLNEALAYCEQLILEVDHRMVRLFSRAFPTAKVFPKGSGPSDHNADAGLLIGSLPSIFRLDKEDFGAGNPGYLTADFDLVARFRSRIKAEGKKICGISWRAWNPINVDSRSIPLELFCRSIDIDGVVFVNLQYGGNAEDSRLTELLGSKLLDFADVNRTEDIDSVAALIACCDMVVSIGNAVAHLAAALGKPTLVLTPFVPGWRWGTEGLKTPWYGSTRILRQESAGDWVEPLAAVRSFLSGCVASSEPVNLETFDALVDIAIRAEPTILPFVENKLKPFRDLQRRGLVDEADAWLDAQLAIAPQDLDLLRTRAFSAFRDNDNSRALQLLEQARVIEDAKAGNRGPNAMPTWDGKPFPGGVVVVLEPNLGEEILVSLFLHDLAECGQKALVEVDGRLLKTMRRSFPRLDFIARGNTLLGEVCRRSGVSRMASSLDLMKIFLARSKGRHVARRLQADPALVDWFRNDYRSRFPGKRIVGLSWRSARIFDGEDQKSIPLEAFANLLGDPGVAVVDLQYGDMSAEVDSVRARQLPLPWRDPTVFPMHDLDRLSAQLCALDCVLTVSNSTAHLAGSLGVSTVVMLPRNPPLMWHWGRTESTNSWYPSVTIARDIDLTAADLGNRLRGLIDAAQ